jgi:sulfoxide reductase heme-binding subunit YedZ
MAAVPAKARAARPILFPPGPLPWLQPAVLVGALAPGVELVAGAARGELGPDPVALALNRLGLVTLALLVASLACTPLKTLGGYNWPIRIRKTLGLCAFFYACAHFATYAVIDQGLAWGPIGADIAKRPFILVGFSALLLLIPLAVTSTAKMLKRLGFAQWKRLHRLVYPAAVLGVVHFWLRVKKDVTEPAEYASVLGALFAVRVGAWLARRRR